MFLELIRTGLLEMQKMCLRTEDNSALSVLQPPPYHFHEFTLGNIKVISGTQKPPTPIELARPLCSSFLFPAFGCTVSVLPCTCDSIHHTLH